MTCKGARNHAAVRRRTNDQEQDCALRTVLWPSRRRPRRSARTLPRSRCSASRAVATVWDKIGPEFERATGDRLNVSHRVQPRLREADRRRRAVRHHCAAHRARSMAWSTNGKVIAETRTTLARAGYGVAVRAGPSKPDVSTTEAFKRALLECNVGWRHSANPRACRSCSNVSRLQTPSSRKSRYRDAIS